jgi:LPPG:FO 2-phospho-L-lactate transferase
MSSKSRVVTLGGGVGAGKFLEGLYEFRKEINLNLIINTSDDIDIYGVRVSPDVDTVIYWLSDNIDRKKGWGIKGDTLNLVNESSSNWFNLGDLDFEYNKKKKVEIDKGMTLQENIKFRSKELGLSDVNILPMSNDKVETYILTSEGKMHFQKYLIKNKMLPEVLGIEFQNIANASPAHSLLELVKESDLIIFCPSNPLISIDPILEVKGIYDEIKMSDSKKVAISPIVNDKAFKGPILNLMKLKGLELSVLGVAEYYKTKADFLLIDNSDKHYEKRIKEFGLEPIVTNINMTSKDVSINISKIILDLL